MRESNSFPGNTLRSRRGPASERHADGSADRASDPMTPLYELRIGAGWRAFRDQSVGFKLACLYLVLEYVRPQSIWPVIDVIPWPQTTVLVGLLAMVAEVARTGRVKSVISVQLTAFLFVIVISLLFAQYPGYGLENWNMFLPWFLIYFFLINTVRGPVRTYLFLLLFMLASFKMSQHGLRSWAASGFVSLSSGVTGAPGWFHNSGEVGIQMCIFLPLATAFWLALRTYWPTWKQIVVAILPVSALATIIGANSRGAVIGAVAAMTWLILTGKQRLRIVLTVVALLALGAVVFPDAFVERFQDMGDDTTSQSRLYYWSVGLDMVKQHPVLGVGYWNWIPYFRDHYPGFEEYAHLESGGYQLPHNIFVQAAAELGLLGLAVYVLLIATSFVLNNRSRGTANTMGQPFWGWMAAGLNAGTIGFLVSAQFVTVLYYPYFWIQLVLTVCLYGAVHAGPACEVAFGFPLRGARFSRTDARTAPSR